MAKKKTEKIDINHPLYEQFKMWDGILNPEKDEQRSIEFWSMFLAGANAGTAATIDHLMKHPK